MLFLYCGLLGNLTLSTVSFSAILSIVSTAYDVGKWPVIYLICAPATLYTPMNFVTAYLHKHFRIHHVLSFGAIL